MNERNVKPWPHAPGVIAQVEVFSGHYTVRTFEARIYGKTFQAATHEHAVDICMQQKRLAAWHEEQLAARHPKPYFHDYSLADELAVG